MMTPLSLISNSYFSLLSLTSLIPPCNHHLEPPPRSLSQNLKTYHGTSKIPSMAQSVTRLSFFVGVRVTY